MPDTMMRLLGTLPPAEPAAARAERTRLGCRARLVRQAQRASATRSGVPGVKAAQLLQPLMLVLGAAYLTEVLIDAFRLYQQLVD